MRSNLCGYLLMGLLINLLWFASISLVVYLWVFVR
jgi:hypothetical protein